MKKRFFIKNKITELYHYEDITKFDVGKILTADDEWVLLEMYDNYGKFDGYMALRLEYVYKISYDTQYLETLEIDYIDGDNTDYSGIAAVFEDFINNVIVSGMISSISTINGDTVIGIIKEIVDGYTVVNEITNNGKNDGTTIIAFEDITAIQVGNSESRIIESNIKKRC